MEKNQKLIIIAVIAITVTAISIMFMFNTSISYEMVELVPNGTSLEIPTNNATYNNNSTDAGVKIWTFKQGSVTSYNSEEALSARGFEGLAGAMAFKTINDMILNKFDKKESVDGYDIYTINSEKLGDGDNRVMYAIILANDDTHDNIIIVTSNKDITLHIAKSVQFKFNEKLTADTPSTTTVSVPEPEVDNISDEVDVNDDSHPEDNEGYIDSYDDNYYYDENGNPI